MSLRFGSSLSQLALGPTCHLPIPTNDHVNSKRRKICSTCCAEYIILTTRFCHRSKPDGLLLLLAQALPCFKPAVPDDVDPDQHDLVNLEIFNNQRETTNHGHHNNVLDLKIRSEHLPHLRRQILCSHILFSSQSQATPCKGFVGLNA